MGGAVLSATWPGAVIHLRRGCCRGATSASKREITSNSSSSMPLWRKRWNVPWGFSSNSSMFCAFHRRQVACVLAREGFGALLERERL
jgi:hypothetical protein